MAKGKANLFVRIQSKGHGGEGRPGARDKRRCEEKLRQKGTVWVREGEGLKYGLRGQEGEGVKVGERWQELS